MPKYWVNIPATMVLLAEVEARDEEEAIFKAFNIEFDIDIKPENDSDSIKISEFETHRKVSEGNVFYGCLSEVWAEEAY